MNFVKILAAGCMMAVLATPITSYASPVQTSPRTGVPVVAVSESAYANVAISQVTNYVNVRTEANTSSAIVGKIYNNCAATILATVDGEGGKWYQIQSGSVTGYIKAEYFITGSEAEEIAKEVGTVFVTINTTTLRLREQPTTESATLTLLSQDAEYIEIGEEGDFVKIEVDQSLSGYVHKDYIAERVEFDCAVSLEEEQQKKAEEERLKKEAEDAIAAMNQLKATVSSTTPTDGGSNVQVETTAPTVADPTAGSAPTSTAVGIIAANPNGNAQDVTAEAPKVTESASAVTAPTTETAAPAPATGNTSGPGSAVTAPAKNDYSGGPGGPGAPTDKTQSSSSELTTATRTAIVAYAKQFLGNPYVYGGTSLTDGTDCSGFTMRIYEHFGINTGRTSRDQAAKGKQIPIDSVQPGDLLFYASGDYINHVAMYIGGGQIIHASTSKTGIIISTAYYRTPYKAVTFLE